MALGINTTINASALPSDVASVFSYTKPLIFYIVGIAIYSIFVFKLYRFVAHRDILKLDLKSKYGGFGGFIDHLRKFFFYVIEHIILVPIVIFFWFSFLSSALFLLGNNSVSQVMIISMALVGAIRVTAYLSEDLSRDLSKMLPFALLAVFLADVSVLSFTQITPKLLQLVSFPQELFSYLLFMVLLELVMRMLFLIVSAFTPKEEETI